MEEKEGGREMEREKKRGVVIKNHGDWFILEKTKSQPWELASRW